MEQLTLFILWWKYLLRNVLHQFGHAHYVLRFVHIVERVSSDVINALLPTIACEIRVQSHTGVFTQHKEENNETEREWCIYVSFSPLLFSALRRIKTLTWDCTLKRWNE